MVETVNAFKPKCKRCGRCCQTQVCLLGFIILKSQTIPCPALIEKSDVYECGLITETRKYAFPELKLNDNQARLLRKQFLVVNNFGEGCDLEEWAIEEIKY